MYGKVRKVSKLSHIRKLNDSFYLDLKTKRPFNDYVKTHHIPNSENDEFVTIGYSGLEDCIRFIEDCKIDSKNIKAINSNRDIVEEMRHKAKELGIPYKNIVHLSMWDFLIHKRTKHSVLYLDYCCTLNGRTWHNDYQYDIRPAWDCIHAISKANNGAIVGITYCLRNKKARSFPEKEIISSVELRKKFIDLLNRIAYYYSKKLVFPLDYDFTYSNYSKEKKAQQMGLLVFRIYDNNLGHKLKYAYKKSLEDANKFISWADNCKTPEAYRVEIW